MKTQLKDSIWIEGFDNDGNIYYYRHLDILNRTSFDILYSGKTSEISEELAKECVENDGSDVSYKDYNLFRGHLINYVETAKESIQSACSQEYCIIYKN